MVKKSKKSRRPKPLANLRRLVKDGEETRFFRRGPWVEHWLNAMLEPPLDKPGVVSDRLRALLSGPDPVNGVQSRHPSMDETELFYDLMCNLKIPLTAHFVGALDKLLWAAHCYTTQSRWPEKLSFEGIIYSHRDYGYADSWPCNANVIDAGDIVEAIFMASAFSMDIGYTEEAWEHLQDGLGLGWGEPDDSARMVSCAQLLAGGQRIREWCAGGGMHGEPLDEWSYSEHWLYKSKHPVGKQRFNEFVAALDIQSELTQSEWVKAVITVCTAYMPFRSTIPC